MKLFALTAAAACLAVAASANPTAPDAVVYDEYGAVAASLTGVAGNADEGAAIMASKKRGNCISCHEVTALNHAPFHGEVGPMLDGVGGYRTAAELRGIVANAKMTFEGSVMPGFYKTSGFVRPGKAYTGKAIDPADITPILSAQDIEDVVAFLMTLQD
ncbi:MAG: sulfur oxidation c-type cytochrome SoxX [Primorskyibacter sp.]